MIDVSLNYLLELANSIGPPFPCTETLVRLTPLWSGGLTGIHKTYDKIGKNI